MIKPAAAVSLLFLFLILLSCSPGFRLTPDYDYGKPVDYGEKIHPGLDYDLKVGTPIIACADGRVTLIVPNHHIEIPLHSLIRIQSDHSRDNSQLLA